MSDKDTLLVLAASYDDVEAAKGDYMAVKALYETRGIGHDFDAAVIQRDAEGKSKVVSKHEQPTRHGLKWGLAIGAATAIFPAIGLIGGMAAGGSIGALAGHMRGGLKDADLKRLADTLDRGQASLVVVYATNMADQIDAAIEAEEKYVSEELKVDRKALDKQIAADVGA